jgi:hypothetical protein
MDDLGVKKGLGIGFHIIDHGPDKILRLAAAGGDKDVIPPADVAENTLLIGEFFGVQSFPVVYGVHIVFKTHQEYPRREIRIKMEILA